MAGRLEQDRIGKGKVKARHNKQASKIKRQAQLGKGLDGPEKDPQIRKCMKWIGNRSLGARAGGKQFPECPGAFEGHQAPNPRITKTVAL